MRLTPLDIREQQFRRVMRGLDPEEVQAFLTTVAIEFESLLAEQKELRARMVDLEEKIAEYRSMEKALRDTLLTAEKVMGDAKESARREAALIIREAEVSAQRATARLSQDLLDMRQELSELRRIKDNYTAKVRWLLRSHLEMIEGHAQEFGDVDASPRPVLPRGGAAQPPLQRDSGATDPPPRDPGASLPRETSPPPAREGGVAGPAVQRPEQSTYEAPRPAMPAVPQRAPVPPVGPPTETWRSIENAPLRTGPSSDDLDDVLRPIAPDGSYDVAPSAYPPPAAGMASPPRPATAEELAQAVRRAERLAAEARAAAERHGALPPAAPAAGNEGWSMDRLREALGGGSQP